MKLNRKPREKSRGFLVFGTYAPPWSKIARRWRARRCIRKLEDRSELEAEGAYASRQPFGQSWCAAHACHACLACWRPRGPLSLLFRARRALYQLRGFLYCAAMTENDNADWFDPDIAGMDDLGYDEKAGLQIYRNYTRSFEKRAIELFVAALHLPRQNGSAFRHY
jgi:hypothetical protein